jgi:DNA polymerase
MTALAELRRDAADCKRCDLWKHATQTVFGSGPGDARVVLVGEQPGDREDLDGLPFVGPAGRLLDEALALSGLSRDGVYLTNTVKHFKWKPRGKRRIHDKPSAIEVKACLPWLSGELEALTPEVLVLLGATAAQALLGRSFRVTKHRGEVLAETGFAPNVVATIHPSSVLRMRTSDERREALEGLAADLRLAAKLVGVSAGSVA